jgi:hypothetical protein
MTPAAKCRRLATMLRAKAKLERDPEARAEWQYTARGYLILANQFERNGCKNISYASYPANSRSRRRGGLTFPRSDPFTFSCMVN